MTRRVSTTRPGRAGGSSSPAGPDPETGGPTRLIGPILSVVGIVVVLGLCFAAFTGRLPIALGSGAGPGASAQPGSTGAPPINVGGGGRTPSPSDPVKPNEKIEIPGQLVYVKAGNLWIQTGHDARQLTKTGRDSMPTWSPDGQWIYFIDTREKRGLFDLPPRGDPAYYTLTYPTLTKIKPDGSGRAAVATGLYRSGAGQWFYWMRSPDVAPNGRTVALVTDGPDPTRRDVVLQFLDLKTLRLTAAPVTENSPYGHQDPAWRPDGKLLVYVKNGREASQGTPTIYRYDPKTKKSSKLSGPGYMAPSWSPDGRFLAVTRTSKQGTDVAILDARGAEIQRITNDGVSWAPVWSPKGDQIVYMHMTGQAVDLKVVTVAGTGPDFTFTSPTEDFVTEFAGLDGGSRAAWYVPPDQLPAQPTSPPTPAATPKKGQTPSATP